MKFTASMSRTLRVATFAMAALFVTTTASAITPQEIQQKGSVKIGVLSGVPIYGTVDANGKPAGYDIDVARLVAKDLGVKAELVPLTPPARIPALQSGKVDFLIATLAVTPEREKAVLFSNPYSAFEMVIFAHDKNGYKTLTDLKNKSVGVNRGSPQETALVRANIPGLKVVRYEDDATVVQALISGQIDAAAIPNGVASAVMKQQPAAKLDIKFTFFYQPNNMAVRLGDTAMRDWLNKEIAKIIQNGELNQVSMKWVGKPIPNFSKLSK